jgi:hypothetical protein
MTLTWAFPTEAETLAGAFGLTIASVLVGLLLAGLVASNWHRRVLLPAAPGLNLAIALRYTGKSVLFGLLITVLMVPFLVAGLYIQSLLLPSLLSSTGNGFDISAAVAPFSAGLVVLNGIVTWLGLLLFCRLGLILPHLALGHPALGLETSWSRTAPMSGPIAALTLIVTILQLPFLVWPVPQTLNGLDDAAWITDVLIHVFYGGVVLLGAALLTELYRRTAPEPLTRTGLEGRTASAP